MTSTVQAQYAGAQPRQSLPFIIGASSVGTLIEWYDFYLYGVLAAFFARHFFPPGNESLALLASLAVFWFGFLLRPFGAIFFGHLGDLIGRKFTFMLTLIMMGAATFLVGCIQTTATMGIVLSLFVVLICRQSMSSQQFEDWGWRIPFWLSAILVLLSIYIRLKLAESPLYARLKEQGGASANPIKETYSSGRNWGLMAIALFGATAPEGVVWYTGQFYALIYMLGTLKLNYITVYTIMMVALTVGSLGFIFFGWLSDQIGRRNIMTAGFGLAIITYWPVFTWFSTFRDNPVVLTILVLYLVILVTMVYGPIAAFLVELFPARIRYSSMSMPYHIGNGWFGGGVPFIGTAITQATGIALGGLIYPMVVSAIGVVVSLGFIREPTHQVRIWEEVGGEPQLVPDQS